MYSSLTIPVSNRTSVQFTPFGYQDAPEPVPSDSHTGSSTQGAARGGWEVSAVDEVAAAPVKVGPGEETSAAAVVSEVGTAAMSEVGRVAVVEELAAAEAMLRE